MACAVTIEVCGFGSACFATSFVGESFGSTVAAAGLGMSSVLAGSEDAAERASADAGASSQLESTSQPASRSSPEMASVPCFFTAMWVEYPLFEPKSHLLTPLNALTGVCALLEFTLRISHLDAAGECTRWRVASFLAPVRRTNFEFWRSFRAAKHILHTE